MNLMAEKKAIKITQISKDFNLKSKDVLDIFKNAGLDKKSGGGAEAEEYELFLNAITKSHQIKNIDDYIDGKTKITVEKPKAEAKPAPKAEEPVVIKEEPKPEPKVEPVAASAPKAEEPANNATAAKADAASDKKVGFFGRLFGRR